MSTEEKQLQGMANEIGRLKAVVGKYEQAVIDTAPAKCQYPGRYVRPSVPVHDYGDTKWEPGNCRLCTHTKLCRIKAEGK